MKTKRAAKKSARTEPFDWGRLLFTGMVAARGLMSEDPEVQKACGDILNECAGKPKTPRGEKLHVLPDPI